MFALIVAGPALRAQFVWEKVALGSDFADSADLVIKDGRVAAIYSDRFRSSAPFLQFLPSPLNEVQLPQQISSIRNISSQRDFLFSELRVRYATPEGEFEFTGDRNLTIPSAIHDRVGPGLAEGEFELVSAELVPAGIDVTETFREFLESPKELFGDSFEDNYAVLRNDGVYFRVRPSFSSQTVFDLENHDLIYRIPSRSRIEKIVEGNGVSLALEEKPDSFSFDSRRVLRLDEGSSRWSPIVLPDRAELEALDFANERFVGVGSIVAEGEVHSAAFQSLDGIDWAVSIFAGGSSSDRGIPFVDVVYQNNQWLAMTSKGSFWQSADGVDWQRRGEANFNQAELKKFLFANEQFVVSSTIGRVWVSEDLSSFREVLLPGASGLFSEMIVFKDHFVAAVGRDVYVSAFAPPGHPSFSSVPSDVFALPGDEVFLSVEVEGEGELSYQWYEGASGDVRAPIAGAVGMSYTTPPLTENGEYWVRVQNDIGQIDSPTSNVVLQSHPVIVEQPEALTLWRGRFDSLTFEADGENLSYQWYEGLAGDTSTPLTSETSSRFFETFDEIGEFFFWARATNDAGFVDSRTVVVRVTGDPPQIVKQPTDVAISYSRFSRGELEVTAEGGDFTYQWYRGEAGDTSDPADGFYATQSEFLFDRDTIGSFRYWVRVTHSGGALDSTAATVTVLPAPPSISRMPVDRVFGFGQSESISVSIDNEYFEEDIQWYRGESGDTSVPIEDSTSSTLSIRDFAVGEHRVWARVSNVDGSADSSAATILIRPSNYESWVASEGIVFDRSAPGFSAGADILPNQLLYVLGATGESRANNVGLIECGTIEVGGEIFATVTFRKSAFVEDVEVAVEEAVDMTNWTQTAVLVSEIANADGELVCTYRTSMADQGFLRLHSRLVTP